MSMDPENETHPLLHSFENETWRSRTRKRCIRIPTEAAITGLILGVFFVVVTLLIVLENVEKTEKDDKSIDKKLLASPGFNQKLADKSWKDEKLRKLENINKDWKIKSDQSDSPKYNKKGKGKSWQDEKQRKFDKVNKGWKILPNVTGNRDNRWDDDLNEDMKDNIDSKRISIVADEYGREENDRWSSFFSSERKDPNLRMSLDEDMDKIVNILQSPMIKRDKVNEQWSKLSGLGWKDYEIRKALLEVLMERRNELNGTGDKNVQRSPMNLDDLWNEINKSWQEKVEEERAKKEYRRLIHSKDAKDPKTINDAWRDKMTVLQSPKATAKKEAREDEGWDTLSEQGWKNKDIEKALFNAWKEKDEKENVLMSPMNIQSLFQKAGDFVKSFIHLKGGNESGTNNYMLSPSNFDALKNAMETSKKYKKDYKKSGNSGKTENDQSGNLNIKDFIDFIMEKIRKQQKEEKEKMDDTDKSINGSTDIQYSSTNMDDFIQNIITEVMKEHERGKKEGMENQKSINDEWQKNVKNLDTTKTSGLNWKTINDNWDTLIVKDQKDEKTDKPKKGKSDIQYSSLNLDDFIENIITDVKERHEKGKKDGFENQKSIKDAWNNKLNNFETAKTSDQKWKTIDDHWKTLIEYERNSYFGKNDGTRTSTTDDDDQKILMSSGNMKWKNVDNGYKKLSTNGWNDKYIKDAIDKVSRDGEQILQSAMGNKNMKWKKVNDGYKKTYNKS